MEQNREGQNSGVPGAGTPGAGTPGTEVPVGAAETYSAEAVEEMKRQHAKTVRALEEQLHDCRVGYALDGLLAKSGAKNPGFLRALVNVRSIPVDEQGNPELSSVKAMLDGLRRTDAYLFDTPAAGNGDGFGPYRAPAAADGDQMSDAEYYRYRTAQR